MFDLHVPDYGVPDYGELCDELRCRTSQWLHAARDEAVRAQRR